MSGDSPEPRSSVVIVGHGPSMLENKHGAFIDSHDVVIRQKRCSETLKAPEHFGSRTDYVCGSWTIAGHLPQDMPGCKYWVFVDSRHEDVDNRQIGKVVSALPCTILPDLCREWNAKYRQRRTAYERPKGMKEFSAIGHPHLSAGFHTLLYTCVLLQPNKIDLVGCDNLATGTFTWSITRGPEYTYYPDHRWDIEHQMLEDVEKEYNVEIVTL